MCGRFSLATPGELIAEAFDLETAPSLEPRYNIAPTQPVGVIRRLDPDAPPEWSLVRLGVPATSGPDATRQGPLINARAETAATRPAFREAFARRRCLIPADGFYEWKAVPGSRKKQPFHIRRTDGKPFAFAGLWEPGVPAPEEVRGSCVILTTEPNELVRRIHDRMPVILAPEAYPRWLDPMQRDAAALRPLLRPFPATAMKAYPVGASVNDARNETPECRAPLSAE